MALKFRRGTTAQKSGSLAFGEPYVNSDLGTLQIGGPTGDITLSSTGTGSTGNFGAISGSGLDITGNANIAGNVTVGGKLTIGDATSDTVNVVASLSSSLIPETTNAFDLGSAQKIWRDLYISTGSIKFVAGTTVVKELTLATITGLESATGSSNVAVSSINSFTGSQLTQNSALATITGSLISTASANVVAVSNLNSFTSSINTTIKSKLDADGVVSGSSQVTISSTNGYTAFSSSLDSRISTEKGRVDAILSASTADADTFAEIVTLINSVDTTNDQAFAAFYTASNGRLNNLETTSASVNTSVSNLNTFSSSANTRLSALEVETTNLELTTASLNTSVTNLNSFSSSANTRFTEIGVVTGSLISSASVDQGRFTTLGTVTASYDGRFTTLATYTGSVEGRFTTLASLTGSNLVRLTNLETTSASVNTSIANINVATASLQTTSASLNTSVSNINTLTSSALVRFSNLETTSGSLNTSVANINTFTASMSTTSNVRFGSLGIGMAASGTSGRIDASGDIVAYSTSDRNFKENITPIPNAIEKIRKISGNTYDWKADMKDIHGFEGNDVGVIAQEIEEVLPQLVTTRETGYKAVKYDKLVALLIEGIKEQQQHIDNLTIQVEELKKAKGL